MDTQKQTAHGLTFVVITLIVLLIGGFVVFTMGGDTSAVSPTKGKALTGVGVLIESLEGLQGLAIQPNGEIVYLVEEKNKERVVKTKTLSAETLAELAQTIEQSGFFNLSGTYQDGPAEGRDVYTIGVATIPSGATTLDDQEEHRVSCKQDACEEEFTRLKDAMIALWGEPLQELTAGPEKAEIEKE